MRLSLLTGHFIQIGLGEHSDEHKLHIFHYRSKTIQDLVLASALQIRTANQARERLNEAIGFQKTIARPTCCMNCATVPSGHNWTRQEIADDQLVLLWSVLVLHMILCIEMCNYLDLKDRRILSQERLLGTNQPSWSKTTHSALVLLTSTRHTFWASDLRKVIWFW